MKLRLTRLTLGLAAGVTVAVAAAFGVGAYVYSQHHLRTLLDGARESALAQGEMILEALDHEMLTRDRLLLRGMIQGFGRRTDIESILLLDRQGRVQYSSGPQGEGRSFSLDSPTCQACHQYPAEERASSRVIEAEGGSVLRTVLPIRNRSECHQCHDEVNQINGVLIMDRDVGALRASMNQDLRWLLAVAGGLTFLLVLALAWILHVVVLRRLRSFETTARLISQGDLEKRVPAAGMDTISWLAREFNTMADSMTDLVKEVAEERERLETVINSIGDGIVVLDPQRRIVAANQAFLHRAGGIRDDVLGCACRDVTRGACDPAGCPTLGCLDSGKDQVRVSERRREDGTLAWEEVHASPIFGPDGRIRQVVEVWRDISERRAAEARLAESHRLASLGLLASGFSHELNTPLGTVLTCVEGILRESRSQEGDALDRSRILRSAEVARDQIMRCRGITQHFLRLSRGQSSPGEIVDLERVLTAVARIVEPTAREHGVQVKLEADGSGARVRADEADIQHAVVNLLLNAIQACDQGGTVTLAIEGGAEAAIRVSDDGCGCPEEELQRIFEPFFSLRNGGTGLGLFLSQNFIRRWGGEIRVRSEPGRGSVFEITLPALSPEPARDSVA